MTIAPCTLDEVNEERTVYLVADEAVESAGALDRWIRKRYKELFETELNGWYTVPELWPKNRSLKVFREWFNVERYLVVIDTVDGLIKDDEI